MFTQWNQVEDWIRNNQLKKWIFTKNDRNNRSGEGAAPNDKILDSEYFPGDLEQKLQLTKQSLEQYGMRCYGYGFFGSKVTDGLYCEAQLSSGSSLPIGIGTMMQTAPAIDKEQLRKEILNEIKLEQYEQERKEFEQERKEFQKEKEGVIGLAIGYLKPVLGALASKRVAGVDADADIAARKINAVPGDEEESPISDEEAEKIEDLIIRFKKVEPDYLRLLESVVTMAENGDATYTMARGFLIKD